MSRIRRVVNSLSDAISEQARASGVDRSRSLLTYCVSPFATLCMLTAMVLNRIVIFASSRRIKQLPSLSRVILRSLAIYLIWKAAYGIFVSMRVYEDSRLDQLLWPSPYYQFDRHTFKDRTFLGLSYSADYYETDVKKDGVTYTFQGPSTAILKPFFLGMCISQVIETFVAVTSGTKPYIESSLTLFEYSISFQEVQGPNQRPPVELLRIALIPLANHLDIHILGLLGLLQYRLIPSTVIGLYSLYICFHLFIDGRIFYAPFSVIVGYLPHLISFAIVVVSLSIYLLAGIFRGTFNDLTITTILNNLESINISLSDDFYTALGNLGSILLNATSNENYVTEAPPINLPIGTYIDHELAGIESCGYGVEVAYSPEMLPQPDDTQQDEWLMMKRLQSTRRLLNAVGTRVSKLFHKDKPVIIEPPVQPEEPEVDLDLLDPEQVADCYPDLITHYRLSETDSSRDYNPEKDESGDNDLDDDDYDDDSAEQISFANIQALVNPSTADEMAENRVFGYHMQHYDEPATRLTRSNFSKYYNDELQLLDLLREKARERLHHMHNHGPPEDSLGTCVICHENSRQIIVWPCKCLSICESCRVSLYVRKFNTCVCCRSKVESYSKVYVP